MIFLIFCFAKQLLKACGTWTRAAFQLYRKKENSLSKKFSEQQIASNFCKNLLINIHIRKGLVLLLYMSWSVQQQARLYTRDKASPITYIYNAHGFQPGAIQIINF